MASKKHVTIYTDGACTGNPGPGGYGVVLMYGEHRRELRGVEKGILKTAIEDCRGVAGRKAWGV